MRWSKRKLNLQRRGDPPVKSTGPRPLAKVFFNGMGDVRDKKRLRKRTAFGNCMRPKRGG